MPPGQRLANVRQILAIRNPALVCVRKVRERLARNVVLSHRRLQKWRSRSDSNRRDTVSGAASRAALGCIWPLCHGSLKIIRDPCRDNSEELRVSHPGSLSGIRIQRIFYRRSETPQPGSQQGNSPARKTKSIRKNPSYDPFL